MKPVIQDLIQVELANLRRHHQELLGILGTIRRLTEILPDRSRFRDTTRELVRIVVEESHFDKASLVMVDGDEEAWIAASFGHEVFWNQGDVMEGFPNVLQNFEVHLAQESLRRRQNLFIEDTSDDAFCQSVRAAVMPAASVSLVFSDFGALVLASGEKLVFTDEDKRQWELLAQVLTHILYAAKLRDSLLHSNENLSLEIRSKKRELEEKTRALSAINALLENVIEHHPQGICLLDTKVRIVRSNKAMRHMLGCQGDEIVDRDPAVFFERPTLFREMVQREALTGCVRLNDVSVLGTKGEKIPTDVFLSRLEDDGGNVTGYFLLVEDMREKKAFAEQLVRTEKLAALGTMAGGVAHDFNNLLMTVLGNTQLLMQQLEGSCEPSALRRLQHIEQAVNDGAHLVRRLQRFTDRERNLPETGSVSRVADIIQDIVELTRPRWKNAVEKRGVRIDVVTELEKSAVAAVNASDLREILTNLVFNAIDAMPEGGTLTLHSRSLGDEILVEVRDTGIGMSPEIQRKIFDPFFSTKGVGNSGLGLSVCWSLVRRYGGRVDVESVVGKGTTFMIRFPAGKDRVTASNDAVTCFKGGDCKYLLVVDDEKEVLELLGDMLRLIGHKVETCHDPVKALELIDRLCFDLVLTDLGMPGVSGWDVARHVKRKNPEVPVILVTGWGAQYEEEDLSEQGIDLVLSKPLSYQKLTGALDRFI